MGSSYTVECKKCGTRAQIDEGGGFTFHLLRCDRCGQSRQVPFEGLGALHLCYLKGLPGPYARATAAADEDVQENYDGEPLSKEEYYAEVEKVMESCRCGGSYRFDAPPRCPDCRSTSLEVDQDGPVVMYD